MQISLPHNLGSEGLVISVLMRFDRHTPIVRAAKQYQSIVLILILILIEYPKTIGRAKIKIFLENGIIIK